MTKVCLIKYNAPLEKDAFATLINFLPDERICEIKNQKKLSQADKMLIGSLLARYMIKKYYNIPFKDQKFSKNDWGKPFLSSHPDIHFNISHSEKYVLCAVSDKPIGVDIEEISPYNEKIANRVFNDCMIKRILTSDRKDTEFTLCWVETEAQLKRIGCGLFNGITPNCENTKSFIFEDAAVAISQL